MRMILALSAVLLSSSLAFADCRVVASGEGGAKVYQCTAPTPPAPPPAPVKCWHLNGALLCTGELKGDAKPSNCGWKKDKYVCW